MQRSNFGIDNASQSSTDPKRKGTTKVDKHLSLENSKFLADFDPEKSSREKRKLTRQNVEATNQSTSAKHNSIFNELGRYKHNNADLCDCLERECPGCHFPCPQCSSDKCGPICRVNRTWAFQTMENEGTNHVIHNKNVKY